MPKFTNTGKLIRRKDRNFFTKVSVATTSFATASQKVAWDFTSTGIALLNEATQPGNVVEYSFDGTTVHGDLSPGLASAGIIFDNRHENTIWFRLKTTVPLPVTIRLETWRTEA